MVEAADLRLRENSNDLLLTDPLFLASFNHPGMTLSTVAFNGNNFLEQSRLVKMALGAKLKLGFIDGTCIRLAVWYSRLSVVDNNCGSKLQKGTVKPMDLSSIRFSSESAAHLANKGNFKLQNKERKDGKNLKEGSKAHCGHCNGDGHTVEQRLEIIGYLDCCKRKKKGNKFRRVAAQVSTDYGGVCADNPPELEHCEGSENQAIQNKVAVDSTLVTAACQEMMRPLKGKQSLEGALPACVNFAGTLF
ncbi:hypothetical protein Ancab_038988 [Ancistrocladus abbreviatus]